MWFKQFRIQNYRSIVDTGWHELATDNITGLIGQNESGKTSILEALNSFYNGHISDDILRSDLSMPVVSCTFSMENKELNQIFRAKKVPERIHEIIRKQKLVTLTRTWQEDKSSYLSFGDEQISAYYNENITREQSQEKKILQDCRTIIEEAQKAEEDLGQLIVATEELQKELGTIGPMINKARKAYEKEPSRKTENYLKKLTLEQERLQKRREKKKETHASRSVKVAEMAEKSSYAQICLEAFEKQEKAKDAWQQSYRELSDLQIYVDGLQSQKEIKGMKGRLDQLNANHLENDSRLNKAKADFRFRLAVTARILKGQDPDEAEDLVEKELQREKKFFTESELAEETYRHIPVVELFEDFSSLLPNSIDLEDIFNLNTRVEGYKAARNFLVVSGLKRAFFEERSSRILKQKIEKLNNEISLNFQDYWRQSLGRNNKIKIHFELEHYDHTHPEKMGKPYLEFWIKDEQERLYPKQRSRGVRWFLSFYLELKANAIEHSDRPRVFLIDEPGLSLHARAQEDVLKVFEDIKADIQIIYSTHSPHLININKLYRLLAVQRAVEDDMRSETLIFDPKSLNEASTDTLSPIYTLMGTKLSDHQFVKKKNNIIVEDTPTYYYLSTILEIAGYPKEIYFLPATGVDNVPTLVNLLMGWKLDFIVLLDDDPDGNRIYRELRRTHYHNDDETAARKILRLEGADSVEDLFSTIDFKNFILHRRVGITESNSEYIDLNELSRAKLAADFILDVQNNQLHLDDFDEETRQNIHLLISRIDPLMS